ncbi:cation diffusion facilitator family transporter [Phycicoccus jejuensis]|jgi:cobalt-zinc-cadmium efflux system protein|uniref:cation diffusion facilitator family transporter n=1 Tax=Phycicoccus jejuensis TaxID=367299 RepID=UPI00384FCF8F
MTGHNHGGSGGANGGRQDGRYLGAALALILVFMAVEVVVGVIASSLALISDAGHMLTDAAAIALALAARRVAARPARGNLTFGWKRVEILSAQLNGLTLWGLTAWFAYEAVQRFLDPPEVSGGLVLVTALVGIVVNLGASWLIARADRSSLNVEGAFQHILNDLFAFIATALAGLVVLLTGWARADAVAALVVAALMAKAGWGLLRDSGRIFLEAAPRGTDVAAIERDIRAVDGVVEVHDLHVWEVTSGFPALSAHVLVSDKHDCHERRKTIAQMLTDDHDIEHTTLQVDHPAPTTMPIDAVRARDGLLGRGATDDEATSHKRAGP